MSGQRQAGGTGGGLRFRLGRIPVSMPWSGVLGIAFIAYLWHDSIAVDGSDPLQMVLWAGLFGVLFYVSILGHELAHAWAATALGFPVHGISLWALGGWTSYERRTPSPGREALIAASGPVSSVLIGLVWFWLSRGPLALDDPMASVAWLLGFANVFLGVWNALPGLPLDGGSVLRSVVWGITRDEHRGTVVAAWSGRVLAVLAFVVPLGLILARGGQPDLVSVAFAGLISAWLWAGASSSLRRARVMGKVPRLAARTLVRPAVVVPHDLPLSEALRRLEATGARSIAVSDAAGTVVAVAQEESVAAVPVERRPWVPVSSVSASLDPSARLHVDLAGEPLLRAMQDVPARDYAVHDATGTVVGVLTTRDVEKALGA